MASNPAKEASGVRMPSKSVGGEGISSFFCNIIYDIQTRASQACVSTCDGVVLQMHYRWTFRFLLGGFLAMWFSWYHYGAITCRSNFNAETEVNFDVLLVCLSYPFLEDNGERRYILYYRSIYWSLFILAVIYYILRKLTKSFNNARCKKLLQDLAANNKTEEQQQESVKSYLNVNQKTHDVLYWKFLIGNIIALAVDLFALFFLNSFLEGRFLNYGNRNFFTRDTEYFKDYISQTFPPFVSCQLNPVNQLVGKRTETFGCHLPLMELYQQLFLWVWVWLIVLIFVTCCYIVFLLCMWLPFTKKILLLTTNPVCGNLNCRDMIKMVENCNIGDIYLLYRIKGHMSHAGFYDLLMWLSDSSLGQSQDPPNNMQQPDIGESLVPAKCDEHSV